MLNNIFLFRFCEVIFCIGVALIYLISLAYFFSTGATEDVIVVISAGLILLLLFLHDRWRQGNRRNQKQGETHARGLDRERGGSYAKELDRQQGSADVKGYRRWTSMSLTSYLIFVVAILIISAVLKIIYILLIHETPQMDFRRYYEVAQMIVNGTDPATVDYNYGLTYQKFLSAFPFTLGYSTVLSFIFRISGISWQAAEIWNVVCSTITAVLVWDIVSQFADRRAAMAALVMAAFWPSAFLYSNMISAESCFTALLFLVADLYIHLIIKIRNNRNSFHANHFHAADGATRNGVSILYMCSFILLGILLGLDAEVRSMAVLLLISIVMMSLGAALTCWKDMKLAPNRKQEKQATYAYQGKKETGGEEEKEKWGMEGNPNVHRLGTVIFLWLISSVLMILSYHITKSLLDNHNRKWIGPQTADAANVGGYNFLVGMNDKSSGGFSMDDLNYLFSEMDRTGSATQAHINCRNEAIDRLRHMSLPQMISLFCRKYQRIWGTDDYGAEWNISLLNSDGNLTDTTRALWTFLGRCSTLWYLLMVGLSGIYVLRMVKQKQVNASILFVILVLGCAATHTILEAQNRYHYYTLYCFAILAAQQCARMPVTVSH